MSAAPIPHDDDPADDPPEGFRLLPTGGDGFNGHFGAVYGRLHGDGVAIGFRVGRRHLNPHGTCHGGALATFADYQAYSAQHEAGIRHTVTPTIGVSIDYLSPARLGDWVEARTDLLRATRTMLFLQTLASAGERPIFRSSGIYKIGTIADRPGSVLGDFFQTSGEPAR